MQERESSAQPLIGRDDLLGEARHCLAPEPGHRRIIMITGGRGMGKSALVNAIGYAARGRGHLVHAVHCGAGTHNAEQILGAIDLACTPAPAHGLSATDPGSTSVLLLIDDFHHLSPVDRDTVAVRIKAAVHEHDIRCIATSTEMTPPCVWREFSVQTLHPMTTDEICALLQHRGFRAGTLDVRELHARAGGNPLAAIELARSEPGRVNLDLTPVPILTGLIENAGRQVVDSFRPTERIAVLRNILLQNVAHAIQEDDVAPDTGRRASGAASADATARLLIHAEATAEELHTAHDELAADRTLPNHVRLLHQSLATDLSNDDLADRLEFLAEDLVAALRYRPAVLVLCRAAAVAAENTRTSMLLARAGSIAAFAGYLSLARAVMTRERSLSYRSDAAGMAATTAFLEFVSGGDVRSVLNQVMISVDVLTQPAHPDSLNQVIASCFAYAVTDGDVEALGRAVEIAEAFQHALDPINILLSRTLTQAGSAAACALDDRALQGAVLASLRGGEPWKPALLHLALPFLSWHPRQYRWLNERFDLRTRLCPIIVEIASMKNEAAFADRGRYKVADAPGASGERKQLPGLFGVHRQTLDLLTATLRGDLAALHQSTTEAAANVAADIYGAAAVIDLVSRNRHEAAFERVRYNEVSLVRWLSSPYGPLEMIDFVECCVRLGRLDDGLVYLDGVRAAKPNFWSTRHAALMLAAEAVLADNDNDALFELALGDLRKVGWSFDLPRVALAYGEWLRRNHRILDSRRQLTHAVDLFNRLGAEPWTRRAEEELRAAGIAQRDSTGFTFAELTGQEHRIASMAASGLTNKEIGQELYLSARTVSGHLYRAFPKLQITKRSALRDALIRYDEQMSPEASSMAG